MSFEKIEICPVCSGKTFRQYLTSTDYTTSGNDFNIVQCTNCSFVITNPRPDKSEIGEYYKSQSYISHTGGSNNLIDRIYLLARSSSLKRKRKLIEKYSKKTSLLDYGCGTGEFLNECLQHGWNGNGIEPSKEARSKAEELNKKTIFSDLSQVIGNQYNTITMWHVLEHVHELNLTLEKLTQSLAANGTVFIAVPNPTSWDANKYGKHWAAYDVPRHLWHFSKENMTQLLNNHSLTVKEVIPMKLDAYYVSLLSEQYKNPNQSKIKTYLLGFINGLTSNIKASRTVNHSSLIYVAKKMKANLLRTLALPLGLIFCECATVTTPMGGPKDEEAPTYESSSYNSSPKHNQKNFKKNIVQLSFSEDIKLKDAKEEIIITPSPGKDVDYQTKGKLLTIEPKEGWKENTTYSITFREGVQDITESNPVENLRLAFSTGPVIDSLSISGSVKDALTEKIPEKITIAIYTSDTFNIFKHAPIYFTKSDKEGNFRLDNLKPGSYHIYAFEDKNKNLKLESQNEQFGFVANTIELQKNVSKISIPLIQIDTRKLKMNKPRSTGEVAFLKFNKNVTGYTLKTTERKLQIPNSFGDDQTEVKLILSNLEMDSILVNVNASDSLLQKIDTAVYVKKGKNQKIDEKFSAEIINPTLELETGNFSFSITSAKLIKSINTDSVILELDSLIRLKFKQEEYKWDTIQKKIELKTIIDKKLIDIEKKISIITGKNFLETFENDSLKGTSKPVNVLTIEETGTLTVEAKTNSQENYVIELLSGDKIVQSVSNQKSHTFKYLEPGNYKVRIVIDKNKNGKWDIGNILLNQEPEKTIYYRDREKKFETPMRANWESVITISF